MSTRTFNILTIDDNEAIHEDYRKVLVGEENNLQLAEAAEFLFGEDSADIDQQEFQKQLAERVYKLDSALQGAAGFGKDQRSLRKQYAIFLCIYRRSNATWLGRRRNSKTHLGS